MSMKKKKKKSSSSKKSEEATEGGVEESGNNVAAADLTATSGCNLTETTGDVVVEGADLEFSDSLPSVSAATWLGTDRDYTYRELLSRVFGILRTNNPDLAGEKRKFTIVPPQVVREGSKKTAFSNIADLAKRMRRPLEHLTAFILTELGTIGSSDGSQRLIIKGRFQQLQIENVLRRYIVEYVTCKTCRSPDTILVKENRLFFMQCESCGSSRSVNAIKTGFKAQTERRAAQRT